MTTRFANLDLSKLPAPWAIRATYEGILAARMQDLVARFAAAGVTYDVGALETDPAKILQEVDSYRELLADQRINEAVLATSLAYATGADLDVIAANFKTVRAAGETDASLRLRAQLAWENLSIGGSYGGYEYQARTVAPVDIADCAVYGHEIAAVPKGEVRIVLLGATANGAVPLSLLQRVAGALSPRDIRKVNDQINVVQATIVPYTVALTLVLRPGADATAVRDAQYRAVLAYVTSRRAIAAPVTFGGIMAAAGHDDAGYVTDVEMTAPWSGALNISALAPIGGGVFEAPICTGVQMLVRAAS